MDVFQSSLITYFSGTSQVIEYLNTGAQRFRSFRRNIHEIKTYSTEINDSIRSANEQSFRHGDKNQWQYCQAENERTSGPYCYNKKPHCSFMNRLFGLHVCRNHRFLIECFQIKFSVEER